MKVIFLPTFNKKILALQTFEGLTFAGCDIQDATNASVLSAVEDNFQFVDREELMRCKFTRLGPQGFFFNKSQKYIGVEIALTDIVDKSFSRLMKTCELADMWEDSSVIVKPMIQAIIDPTLYESCSSEIDAYALDRIQSSGGMTAAQVSEEFGISLNQASIGLFSLAAKGFVQCWERAGRVFKVTELGMIELEQIGWTPTNHSNNDEMLQANNSTLSLTVASSQIAVPEPSLEDLFGNAKFTSNHLRILLLRCQMYNRERIEALGLTNYHYRTACDAYAKVKNISRSALNKVLRPGTPETKELIRYINSRPDAKYIKSGTDDED